VSSPRTSRESSERLGRVLVELIRRPAARTADPLVLLDRVPSDRLVDRACDHRVPGVVHRSLSELGVSDARFVGLRTAYQMATLSHRRCMVDLQTMAGVLAELPHPWLVVKGPVLVEVGYGDPGARLYEDLDLVVAPTDLPAALTAIEGAGGRVTDLNWPMVTKLRRAEIPMLLPDGMLADLHWHLLVTPAIRSRFAVPMDELVERRRTVRLGGLDVATLDPVDGLLYLCLHGSLSGGNQLVWLKDLDQMMDGEVIDWDELVRRAVRYRAGLVVAMQLERTRVVFGAPVPESVPATLAGDQVWWRWWRSRERSVGMARWGGEDDDDSRFVSATSDGSVASALQLARTVAADTAIHYFRRRRAAGPNGSPGEGAEEAVPELYRAVGSTGARAEYVQLVSTGRWA
jgi:Uncharacterised nucleotidyltransferase